MIQKILQNILLGLFFVAIGLLVWSIINPPKTSDRSYWEDVVRNLQEEIRIRPVVTNTVYIPMQRVWITSGELEHVQYASDKAQDNDWILLWPGVHVWPGTLFLPAKSISMSGITIGTNAAIIQSQTLDKGFKFKNHERP